MKYLILEDEINAYEYLRSIIAKVRPEAECLDHLDSVEEGVNWLQDPAIYPDVIFMDIQLSDGISFEIFNHLDIKCPVIFTTAYDQFAIKAFKVNGLDYLLKPITQDDMSQALNKLDAHLAQTNPSQNAQLSDIVKSINTEKKNRFLVKKGNHFEFIRADEVAFVHSEDSLTFLYTKSAKRHIYSKTINELMQDLDPQQFFQINRGQVVHIDAIHKIHPYLNQRLKLELNISTDIEFVVSRNKMMDFKVWVDS